MTEIVEKFLVFIPVILFCFLTGKWLFNSRPFRVIVIGLHALLLCILTIFIFNRPSWRWGEMAADTKEAKHDKPDPDAYRFVWDNFILVDNSLDKQLVPAEGTEPGDSLQSPITHRQRLDSLMHLLLNHIDNVDLVVIDIGFEAATGTDSLLSARLRAIAQKGKLLLSADATPVSNVQLQLDDSVYANIREQTSDRLFVSHYLLTEGRSSLPYRLYIRIAHAQLKGQYFGGALLREKLPAGKAAWVENPFLPKFSLLNERLLLEGDTDSATTRHQYFLGETVTAPGTGDFVDNLRRRHAHGQKNFVMVGAFSSGFEDVHQTLFKDLHGPVILFNILYALVRGEHHVSPAFILMLFGCYALISWLLLYRALGLSLLHGKERTVPHYHLVLSRKGNHFLYNALQLIIETLIAFFEFLFVEEPHFIFLTIMVVLVKWLTGKMINALSLTIYLGIVYVSLKYIREKLKQ